MGYYRASTVKIYIKNRVETLDIVTFEFFSDSAAKKFPTRLLVIIGVIKNMFGRMEKNKK